MMSVIFLVDQILKMFTSAWEGGRTMWNVNQLSAGSHIAQRHVGVKKPHWTFSAVGNIWAALDDTTEKVYLHSHRFNTS